jgi:hypothetical protein
MDPELADLLTALVEKIGLLRSDMKKRNDFEKYEGRLARIEQKVSSLAERLSRTDPDLAKRLHTAWQLPGRSLAFRNAEHQRGTRRTEDRRHETPETADSGPATGDRTRDTE